MLGAHMDSWHSGTGATDNGAGCAAIMEAVRILKATGLKPRRTIRIGLWTGEEEGLLGSKAYVEKHFGKLEDVPTTRPTTGAVASGASSSRPTSRPAKRLVKRPEYDALSVYFNLDNGSGTNRGLYKQGNDGVRPYFRKWLAAFVEDGAQTLTLRNTGGTDHLPFDAIGLPGFQFIQDRMEYWTRTHHSNQDVYERIPADDLKEAATVLATFAYQAANLEEKLPRKALQGVSE
jgi:carboxypeptidase Q